MSPKANEKTDYNNTLLTAGENNRTIIKKILRASFEVGSCGRHKESDVVTHKHSTQMHIYYGVCIVFDCFFAISTREKVCFEI